MYDMNHSLDIIYRLQQVLPGNNQAEIISMLDSKWVLSLLYTIQRSCDESLLPAKMYSGSLKYQVEQR